MTATNLTQNHTSATGTRRFWPKPQTIRENITGWVFISPAILLVFIFGLFPIGYAFYMSLHRWRIQKGRFLWFDNYTATVGDWWGALLFVLSMVGLYLTYRVWTGAFRNAHSNVWPLKVGVALVMMGASLFILVVGWDRMMGTGHTAYLNGLVYTFYFAFASVPIQLALGLILAYVLYQNIRGKEFFRMIFFLPYVTPAVAAAVIFRVVFSPRENALANSVLGTFGVDAQRWIAEPRPFVNAMFGLNLEGFLAGPSMALISVVILGIWTYVGYNVVIFLAGLGAIPADLYEAARVDGASEWNLFRSITLPLLSPITFYLSILGFIGTFKAFNTIYVMRDPFAQGTTDVASIVVFDTFYRASRYGEATAQAIVLFLIILALTQVQRNVFEKRVFYG